MIGPPHFEAGLNFKIPTFGSSLQIANFINASLTHAPSLDIHGPFAMNASRTICSRCSSQLLSAAVRRPAGVVAGFSSLADAPPSAAPPHDASSSSSTPRGNNLPRASNPKTPNGRPRSKRLSRAHKSQESALSLFNDVVSPKTGEQQQLEVSAAEPLGELEVAAKCQALTRTNLPVEKQIESLRKDIVPYCRKFRGQVSKPIYLAAAQLLRTVTSSITSQGISGKSIEVSQMYSAIGNWDLDIRNELVLNLCRLLQNENSAATRTALVQELIDLWRHISHLKRLGSTGVRDSSWPTADELAEEYGKAAQLAPMKHHDPQRSPSRMLAGLFLRYPASKAQPILPGLLATLAVLSDPKSSGPNHQIKAGPLLEAVRTALSTAEMTPEDLDDIFHTGSQFGEKEASTLKAYVTSQWPAVNAMLFETKSAWDKGLRRPRDNVIAPTVKTATFHKQLRIAYRARNKGGALGIWKNMLDSMEQHPELVDQMRDEPEFLDFWVFVWCALRRSSMVQQTVELMQKIEIQPTLRTYTSMMHGWKKCKDANKIEALWEQLEKSGIVLDTFIWTERVSGLVETGRPEAAIRAVAQMMASWKKAVQDGNEDGAVKPSIEVVNAVFKGLLVADPQAAHDVLAWANREGVQPNVRTYNIMISEAFRCENPGEVQTLLSTMRQQNVDPDSATFTILLEEVLGRMDGATAAEQVQAIDLVLADIAAAGLKPNYETYGKMLYAVVNLANGSDEAVAAVQRHMRSRNLAMTPHMVTMLIERALARDPPNIDAVRNVLHDNKLVHVGQGDQTLWERVMTAFAVVGEADEAMAVFNNLAEAGRPVTSLSCLTDLLRTLLAHGDYKTAQHVVDVVLSHKIKSKDEFWERYWRHHFWHMARENGLLKDTRVPEMLQN